ncbi:hypothetical protein LEP1GSC047_4234 [Leptospira inadai serovar Lyme str. 10]|uniref:Uncharacterized protein n=1 Tax=Leptospira inadai serovar Lyme str. 10 TaxID=1049790 RepID=V6HK24_9LEPT|nr:hypothetical protein LEP1GSC047_4234 [Leptospira inadai serovar Lyme str. 10]
MLSAIKKPLKEGALKILLYFLERNSFQALFIHYEYRLFF